MKIPFVWIGIFWVLYFLSVFLPNVHLELIPHKSSGLIGILLAPFVHKDLEHLILDSLAFLGIVGIGVLYLRCNQVGWLLIALGLLSGALTWILARKGSFFGIQGVIFGLLGHYFFTGIIESNKKYLLSFLGGCLGLFVFYQIVPFTNPEELPLDQNLFGFLSGLITSQLLKESAEKLKP